MPRITEKCDVQDQLMTGQIRLLKDEGLSVV